MKATLSDRAPSEPERRSVAPNPAAFCHPVLPRKTRQHHGRAERGSGLGLNVAQMARHRAAKDAILEPASIHR